MQESPITKLARKVVRNCLKPALQPAFPARAQRIWAAIATRTLSVPSGVRFSRSILANVPVETVRAKANQGGSQGAVLFLHGGAFIIGSPGSHRSITGRLAKLTGATVFAPDYRLAPEHPFPAALDDVVACYRALLDQGRKPERIAVAGDSAGGGLVVSLCLRLKSEGLPQPACVALISPWCDLTLSQLAPIADDALLRPTWLAQGAKAYLTKSSAREPFVSPLFADLSGLPPILIHAAAEEILRNDSRRLAESLAATGASVIHHEFPRMWHDFQLYAGIVPEATQAVAEMAAFIGAHLAESAQGQTARFQPVQASDRGQLPHRRASLRV